MTLSSKHLHMCLLVGASKHSHVVAYAVQIPGVTDDLQRDKQLCKGERSKNALSGTSQRGATIRSIFPNIRVHF